jgi:hypothetical protein
MKREAGGKGEFSVGRIFGAATPPGRGRIFGAATPPGALVHVKKVHVKKVTVTFFFAPHALACRSKVQRDLKILVTLRTAVLQVPSKSYENRTVRSAFVHFSNNRGN